MCEMIEYRHRFYHISSETNWLLLTGRENSNQEGRNKQDKAIN